MAEPGQPQGEGRSFEIIADARIIDRMKKEAVVRSGDLTFTLACDESPGVGGHGSAPTPMQYLVAAVAF